MLSSLRKFSGSIYAKILLGIIVIPFVFWGMGSSFTGGNKNVVVKIDNEKYSIQDFSDYIQKFAAPDQKITKEQIEEFLSLFIGDILVEKEIDHRGIKLSDSSLSQLIKSQKDFKRENKFSRIEYEKFLLKNNIPAHIFENNLSRQEKKRQLFNLIGGGLIPSNFLVNSAYDKINQKRHIQFFNLESYFKKKFKYTDDEIKSYYEKNKDAYKEVYKSTKILELDPKNLIGSDDNEYNEIFFKKLDEIDDLLFQNENLDYITQKYNLEKPNLYTSNEMGKDINLNEINNLPANLNKKIFSLSDEEPAALIEINGKYFIIEIIKTEIIRRKLDDKNLRKEIILNLENNSKRELISGIISNINQNNFDKRDFVELSKKANTPIKNIILENLNDDKTFKKEIIKQIYTHAEKKVVLVHNFSLSENYLIYIDKIDNVTIKENSEDYKNYLNLYKLNLSNKLFNTYDAYIKKKYKIDINYNALNTVKNYFN